MCGLSAEILGMSPDPKLIQFGLCERCGVYAEAYPHILLSHFHLHGAVGPVYCHQCAVQYYEYMADQLADYYSGQGYHHVPVENEAEGYWLRSKQLVWGPMTIPKEFISHVSDRTR